MTGTLKNNKGDGSQVDKRKILLLMCIIACLMYMYLYLKESNVNYGKLMFNGHNIMFSYLDSKLNNVNSSSSSTSMSHDMSHDMTHANQTLYKLLWYQAPFWINRTNIFPIPGCKYENCKVTFDKNQMGACDAVLFHHDLLHVQPKKFKDQLWIFVSFEPGPYTSKGSRSRRWENAFDWTMSFRKDSEGYGPYREIVPRHEKVFKNYSEIFEQKTKDVVWFVSNCETSSRREDYVKQMQEVINIDLFGKCGNMSCRYQDCKSQVIRKYKFYLAFENAICKDYSSEKTFDVFHYGMNIIPVVRGNPDTGMRNYNGMNVIPVMRGNPNIKSLLPKDTYISSLDFNSPKDLALYLKTVGSNLTLYTTYLSNIDKYTTTDSTQYTMGMCSLCKMLNKGYKRKQKLNINKWLSGQCITPTDF